MKPMANRSRLSDTKTSTSPLTTSSVAKSSIATTSVTEQPSEEIVAMTTPPATKKEKKQARKLAANSSRISAAEIFTEADYSFVSGALYGKTTWGKSGSLSVDENVGQDLKETTASTENRIDDGPSKSHMESYSKRLRNATRRNSPGSRSVASDLLLGVDLHIFERLGIQLDGVDKWSKKRKERLKKLAAVIAEDLEVTKREDRETEIRKAGFRRFVNKRTVTNLDDLHEQFSWSTGEIKKQDKARKKESQSEYDHPIAPQTPDASLARVHQPADWTQEMVYDETSRLYHKLSYECPLTIEEGTGVITPLDFLKFREVFEEIKRDHSALMLKRVAEESAYNYEIIFINENGNQEQINWTWPGCMPDIVERALKKCEGERKRLELEADEVKGAMPRAGHL
jgi:hypothetical protein